MIARLFRAIEETPMTIGGWFAGFSRRASNFPRFLGLLVLRLAGGFLLY